MAWSYRENLETVALPISELLADRQTDAKRLTCRRSKNEQIIVAKQTLDDSAQIIMHNMGLDNCRCN